MIAKTGRQSRLRHKMVRTQDARWGLLGVSLIGLGIAPLARAGSPRPGESRTAQKR